MTTPTEQENYWKKIAKQFHDRYEQYAPFYGYITNEATRIFNADSNNGRLMIAVVEDVVGSLLPTLTQKHQEEMEKVKDTVMGIIVSAQAAGTFNYEWIYGQVLSALSHPSTTKDQTK